MWGTPRVGMERGGNFYYDRGRCNLEEQVGAREQAKIRDQVKMWPTAQARDWKGSSGRSMKGEEMDLPTKVKMWPTPTANEDACGKSTGKMQAMLGNHPALGKDEVSGSLNPQFVEWLMGYPKDWTETTSFVSGRTKTPTPQESPPESSTERTA